MKYSEVYVSMKDENEIDCSFAWIRKSMQEGESSVLLVLKDLELGIFDYDELIHASVNSFHYLLLKHYLNSTLAYQDFLKLIGKMCKKDIKSKYFLKYKQEDNRMIFFDFNHEEMIEEQHYEIYDHRLLEFRRYMENCCSRQLFQKMIRELMEERKETNHDK